MAITCYADGMRAAVFSAPNVAYHGPRTLEEMKNSSICIGQLSQELVDYVLQHPTMVFGGQQWGKRVLVTHSKLGAKAFAPDSPLQPGWRLYERLELCAAIMRDAPNDQSMGMIMPMSLAKGFLKRQHCDDFAIAPQLLFSQMEALPHFIVPYNSAREPQYLLQTYNAVSKFISATDKYQAWPSTRERGRPTLGIPRGMVVPPSACNRTNAHLAPMACNQHPSYHCSAHAAPMAYDVRLCPTPVVREPCAVSCTTCSRQVLEQRYLSSDFACPDSAAGSAQISLYSQSGAHTLSSRL
jgi:hypothetical protein